jgi:hypothetical protein
MACSSVAGPYLTTRKSMNAFKIAVKLFAAHAEISEGALIPIYHHWIQDHALPDHLLIDVAVYEHVPDGPGTVLVAHEANIYSEIKDGIFGVQYGRKLPAEGEFIDRLRQATSATLLVASLLENDPALVGKVAFRTNELRVRINDRLLAPNNAATFTAAQPGLQNLAAELFPGASTTVEFHPSEQGVFEVSIRSDQSPGIAALRERLNQPVG